eukprot:7380774-Prymnesium_polylepis.1
MGILIFRFSRSAAHLDATSAVPGWARWVPGKESILGSRHVYMCRTPLYRGSRARSEIGIVRVCARWDTWLMGPISWALGRERRDRTGRASGPH